MVLCGVVPVHLTCGKCPNIILQQTEYVTLIVTGNGLALTGQWFIICDALFLMVLYGVVPVHLTCGKCPDIIPQQTKYLTLIVTVNGFTILLISYLPLVSCY